MTKVLAFLMVGVSVATVIVLLVMTTRLPQEAEANETQYEVVSELPGARVCQPGPDPAVR